MTSLADPDDFLSSCSIIDADHPSITKQASELASNDPLETARRCFKFVRDEIRHSSDYQLNPVTCRASEVLRERTGYCYAKSHLLAAILRVNGLPTGLCYQRLALDDHATKFCLHGLNAIFLPEYGWYRVDSRGNRSDIKARFDPPHEHLAFTTDLDGEYDIPGIFVSPRPEVVECLTTSCDWAEALATLPDVPHEYPTH